MPWVKLSRRHPLLHFPANLPIIKSPTVKPKSFWKAQLSPLASSSTSIPPCRFRKAHPTIPHLQILAYHCQANAQRHQEHRTFYLYTSYNSAMGVRISVHCPISHHLPSKCSNLPLFGTIFGCLFLVFAIAGLSYFIRSRIRKKARKAIDKAEVQEGFEPVELLGEWSRGHHTIDRH